MSAPVTITGWVGNNPALTLTTNDRRRTTVRVATTHRYRAENGAWTDGETTWYSVTFWDDAAESVAKSLHSGDPVVVTGRLVLDRWDAPDGSPRAELALRGATIGHDLTRGTATYMRVLRETRPSEAAPADGPQARGFEEVDPSAPDPFEHGPATVAEDMAEDAADGSELVDDPAALLTA